MKVLELLRILQGCDTTSDVFIDQFFDTHTDMPVRSVQIMESKVVITDHYLKVAEQTFTAFDGATYITPAINERMVR